MENEIYNTPDAQNCYFERVFYIYTLYLSTQVFITLLTYKYINF